ncbi:MAG: patatin-like phospholipase family protein [Acidobacteriota bacterium]|nr:patatin-like phospholipase family protein [Acidobacteriota bacterium]
MGGGGARAAYQVGVLRFIASRYPNLAPGILTGVSAGAINAVHLAARPETFAEAIEHLSDLWLQLSIEKVFKVGPLGLSSRVGRWGTKLLSGGAETPRVRSLVDTAPLRTVLETALGPDEEGRLPGIARNLRAGRLDAVALTASSYTTGRSVTWVEHREGCGVLAWENPARQGVNGCLRIDHVMASSALPFFFPAVEVNGAWYGDGGIRLTAPLSPAIHLGARRIIAVSTRYARTEVEAERRAMDGYPPPAQVAGVLLNAIFLDLLDADAVRLQQINDLLDRLPEDQRGGRQHIDLLVLRPSRDLGRLANEFEADLPRAFRFLVRGLGSRETRSNDMLSLLMFQSDYLGRMVELGEADALARAQEIDALLVPGGRAPDLD